MANPTARIVVQLLAALLLAAALAAIALTAGIPVTTDVTAVALRLLAALLVTTLVFERGLEVVVQLLRQREATDLEHRLEDAREAMRSHRADEALEADPGARAAREAKRVARVSEATRAWRDHRDGTRLRTLSFAFAGGLVLAALGFRFFEFLLDARALAAVPIYQQCAFRVVDGVLTGGVIAGGSDGIHKIMQAITDLAQLASRSAAPRGDVGK